MVTNAADQVFDPRTQAVIAGAGVVVCAPYLSAHWIVAYFISKGEKHETLFSIGTKDAVRLPCC